MRSTPQRELSYRHWSIGKDVGIVRGKYKGKSVQCTVLRWLEKSIEVDIILAGTMESRRRVLRQSSLDLEDLYERYISHRDRETRINDDELCWNDEGISESIDSTILRLARMTIDCGYRCEDIQRGLELCCQTITNKAGVSSVTLDPGE